MEDSEVRRIEIDLLLEAIYRRYGYDFRSYARASVERRVRQFMIGAGHRRISELIPAVLHDPEVFSGLARQFSIAVTEMFRDPQVYATVREKVCPILMSYPFVKVWHAGCATGEEVYSLAIVLEEAGVLKKATIFGTDFNDHVLDLARRGIYPLEQVKEATVNYQRSGGARSFSEYYHAGYDGAAMAASLKERVTYANHNLAADAAFSEVHLVFCRNVLIYFNRELQDRALRIFSDSLVRGGYLVLGTKEDLRFSAVADMFEAVDREARVYRKKVR